ncbi:AAA family ATPase [Actinoplanes sp. NPDC049668]|uniref:AAA family ATPase n=1 Tax=unclassified Actinoplanes TaxID=2626549 RepID=UPI0033B2443D
MSRRLVVVLFTDLVGWTSLAERLDPEPLQLFLESYYDICVTAVERHGGVVEKFIGDAVMAVFGVERAREDDALSALSAAFGMRDEVSRLVVAGSGGVNPAIHCGLAAGEALVTHSARAGVRIVGDVVNLAARLQSAAPAGEILVNETMARLVQPHAAVAPLPPLTLKGKREPTPAWRAYALPGGPPVERARVPMVDREPERTRLLAAFREVADAGHARAVLLVGPPGVGKSRLVRDAVEHIRRRDGRTLAAVGRCLPHAEPGGYGPLGQVLDTLLNDGELADRVAGVRGGRLLEVLSFIHAPAHPVNGGTGPGLEEISWAMREALAHIAPRPAVLVWEDLHWAEPALLGIVTDLITSLRGQPVLSICVSRHELPRLPMDDVPWSLLEIASLSQPETVDLVGHLMTATESAEVMAQSMDVLDRVVDDCAGNPLYAELMVETLALGYAPGDVPPSIVALIGAMIDRLPADSARLLEMASVIGTDFTLEQLAVLGGAPAPHLLNDLIGRQMVLAGARPGSYRFEQHLVHGVVYGRLDKRERLEFHRRLAEQDVNPAVHLGAVVGLLRDLRPDDPQLAGYAAKAAEVLLAEGTLALRRRNLPTALDLLRRAQRLPTSDDDPHRRVATIRLSDALLLAGDLAGAREVVDGSPDRLHRVHRSLLAVRAGEPAGESVAELTQELGGEQDDHLGWSRLQQVRMLLEVADGRFLDAERSARSALTHAEAMADDYESDRLRAAICELAQWSPMPVRERLAFVDDVALLFAADRSLLAPVQVVQARLLALVDELDRAWAALAGARRAADDLRLTMTGVLVEQGTGMVASLAGEHERAERHLAAAARSLETAGHRPAALTLRALAVRERLRRGPDDRAMAEVRALGDDHDRMDLRGRIISGANEVLAGARTGRRIDVDVARIRALLERTDDACLCADVLTDLAMAQRRCGDDVAARTLAGLAADRYAAIGALLPLRRIRAWQ